MDQALRFRRRMGDKFQFDLIAATFRALDAKRLHPLINDRFAQMLVEAAGDQRSLTLLKTPVLRGPNSDEERRIRFVLDCLIPRTRFVDDIFVSAAALGVRQIVLFGAGLDTRAYRIRWPEATFVFEIDDPATLEFKGRTLATCVSACARLPVHFHGQPDSWVRRLCASGFDPESPSAWVIQEDILIGMRGWEQDALFEQMIELSAANSLIICDADIAIPPGESWESMVDPVLPTEFVTANFWLMTYPESRMTPEEWLNGHGWTTYVYTVKEIAEHYGSWLPLGLGAAAQLHLGRRLLVAFLQAN